MADKSVVDVYPLCPHPPVRPLRATLWVGYVAPLHGRNALPWPKSSRSTGYTFSQTALNNDEMGGRGFRHGTEGDVLVEGNQAAVVFDRKGEQVEVG